MKTDGEQNVRLTTGLRPVYPRDDTRPSFFIADQWTVTCLSLETIFMQGMFENLSNPEPRHITGKSRQGGARRGGGVDRGWERDADGSVRTEHNRFFDFADDGNKTLLDVSLEAPPNELVHKPVEEQTVWLTSALNLRDHDRSSFLAADNGFRRLIVSVNHFSHKACPSNCCKCSARRTKKIKSLQHVGSCLAAHNLGASRARSKRGEQGKGQCNASSLPRTIVVYSFFEERTNESLCKSHCGTSRMFSHRRNDHSLFLVVELSTMAYALIPNIFMQVLCKNMHKNHLKCGTCGSTTKAQPSPISKIKLRIVANQERRIARQALGQGATAARICPRSDMYICLHERITCRIQSPDIQQAGRGGPAHSGRRGGARQGRMGYVPTGRFAQKTTVHLAFPKVEENCFERLSGSTDKRNLM